MGVENFAPLSTAGTCVAVLQQNWQQSLHSSISWLLHSCACVHVFVCLSVQRPLVCDNYPIHTNTPKLGSMHTNLRQRQQLAHSTEDQRTFVYLPYLQVVVTESGWHWKRKENSRKHFGHHGNSKEARHVVTTATIRGKKKKWFLKVRHLFIVWSLSKKNMSTFFKHLWTLVHLFNHHCKTSSWQGN